LTLVWSHAGHSNSTLLYCLYDIITYRAAWFSSLKIIQVIKSRRMRWVGHLAHMGERKGVYRVLVRNLRKRDHLEDPGIDRRIIIVWIIRKWDGGGME